MGIKVTPPEPPKDGQPYLLAGVLIVVAVMASSWGWL